MDLFSTIGEYDGFRGQKYSRIDKKPKKIGKTTTQKKLISQKLISSKIDFLKVNTLYLFNVRNFH